MKIRVTDFARLHKVALNTVYLWGRAGLVEIGDGCVDAQAATRRLAAAGRSRIDPLAPLPNWLLESPGPARRGRPRRSAYLPAAPAGRSAAP